MNATRRLVLALAAAALSSSGFAQVWPAKPIRIVVPFPPGGGTDIIARETSQRVARATGWTFVIDNRPGAGGNLGVDAVAKSPADGYTIVLGQSSNLAINPSLYAKLPYDPQKDLAPIVLLANAPLVMVTGTPTPYKTLADAVNAAKARPGQVNFASPGNGTVAHLTSELFQKAAGVKTQHVPYKGAGEATMAMLSGTIDFQVASTPGVMGNVKGGKARLLAVSGSKRLAALPDVPTFAEAGLKNFGLINFTGLWAPKGTPQLVIDRLQKELATAMASADMKAFADGIASEPGYWDAATFAKDLHERTAYWGKVAANTAFERQ